MNDRVLVANMIIYIERNLKQAITAEDMALQSGYSVNRLRQKFYNVTGDTPSGYLRKRRLTEAAKAIMDGEKLAEIALTFGYSSQDNFTTAFRSYFGVTPSELSKIEGKYRRFIRNLREAYTIMEIANLKQPPLNTTLMGCVKGALDYFEQDYSIPMLYGLTGHAFLINIHGEMCPSGPYVWDKKRFYELLSKLGATMLRDYVVTNDTPATERDIVETELKRHLGNGDLCMLDFMEHQLVSGYDEKGLIMLQPWNGRADSELRAITFGSWEECLGREGWAAITVIAKSDDVQPVKEVAKDALRYAKELYANSDAYQVDGYQIGYGAYDWWIDAVKRGLGESHGNWWNGTVWSECRDLAARFFNELPEHLENSATLSVCEDLSGLYKDIATNLNAAKEKSLDKIQKVKLLEEALALEHKAEAGIDRLLVAL